MCIRDSIEATPSGIDFHSDCTYSVKNLHTDPSNPHWEVHVTCETPGFRQFTLEFPTDTWEFYQRNTGREPVHIFGNFHTYRTIVQSDVQQLFGKETPLRGVAIHPKTYLRLVHHRRSALLHLVSHLKHANYPMKTSLPQKIQPR